MTLLMGGAHREDGELLIFENRQYQRAADAIRHKIAISPKTGSIPACFSNIPLRETPL